MSYSVFIVIISAPRLASASRTLVTKSGRPDPFWLQLAAMFGGDMAGMVSARRDVAEVGNEEAIGRALQSTRHVDVNAGRLEALVLHQLL
jgi:hypothetical protein